MTGCLSGILRPLNFPILEISEPDKDSYIRNQMVTCYRLFVGRRRSAFYRTPQYCYIGEPDTSDAVPYGDGFDRSERQPVPEFHGKRFILNDPTDESLVIILLKRILKENRWKEMITGWE